MVSRVVWIYPFWHVQESLYQHRQLHLGRAESRGVRYVCECEKTSAGNLSCAVVSDRARLQIPSSRCTVRQQVEVESIRDVYARTRLPAERGWLGDGPLLLDIDEAFFGVRMVRSQLLDNGLRWRDVARASDAVAQLFCPKSPAHERLADRWFFELATALDLSCVKSSGAKPEWCLQPEAALSKFMRPGKANDDVLGDLVCSKDTGDRAFLSLWRVLRAQASAQISLLRQAGLCFRQTLRSAQKPKLHLCIGSDDLKDSPIEHYPSASELEQQFERVQAILSSLPRRPRLITIARSSRDGYVPRDLQARIEHRLIELILSEFKLKSSDVLFDVHLLNGKQGDWDNRNG